MFKFRRRAWWLIIVTTIYAGFGTWSWLEGTLSDTLMPLQLIWVTIASLPLWLQPFKWIMKD